MQTRPLTIATASAAARRYSTAVEAVQLPPPARVDRLLLRHDRLLAVAGV